MSHAFKRHVLAGQDESARDARRRRPAIKRSAYPRVDTHWSRLLHHDLFTGEADDMRAYSREAMGSESFFRDRVEEMGAETTSRQRVRGEVQPSATDLEGRNRDLSPPRTPFATKRPPDGKEGSRRFQSPLAATAILLTIYIAIYLAVAGIVHVMTLRDSVASARLDRGAGPLAAVTPPRSAAHVDESSAKSSPEAFPEGHGHATVG